MRSDSEKLRAELEDILRAHRESIEHQIAQLRASFHGHLSDWRHEERLNELERRFSEMEDRMRKAVSGA